LVLLGGTACASRDVEIEISDGHDFSSTERRAIQRVADAAAHDVRALLPTLPKRLKLIVRTGKDVIPETGETATAVAPAEILWTIDPDRDVLSMIRIQLRPTLFHELHHLVRELTVPRSSLLDAVVTEGMATAFERDFGGVSPPWGDAPPEDWTRELFAQPETASHQDWLFRHPDGRRWIGMRVGTFVVDRVTKATGCSSAELVSVPTEEILTLAQLR
jgi:uncharacterized protein YjaZ